MKKPTVLALAVTSVFSAASVNASVSDLVKPIHPSLMEQGVQTLSDDKHPCDDPSSSEFAQCNIANPANDFHWVTDDYRDNVVQVVYGASTCGGLLVDGDLILTARHCTPDWNEETPWEFGSTVKVYQGVESQASSNLVYEGEAEIVVRDTDQRVEDGINYLKDNWEPTVDSVVNDWLNRDAENYAKVDFEGRYYSDMRAFNTSYLNDVALIKLPREIAHSSNNAFVVVDNLDRTLDATYETYASLVNPSSATTFSYQGWGKNAYGVTPESMKKWELSFYKSQVMANEPTFEGPIMFFNFDTDINFLQSCDTESLINSGDSGTPLFSQENYNVGIASRIWGGACGFAADWSGHLTNYEFYLDSINRLVAPSGFESIVYTDSSSIEWTFDIQNLTRNSQAIIPSLTGQFNLSHDCNQTLEPLEHCRMTLSFVGDKSTKAEVAGELQLNSSKVIPISLVVTGTETPPVITEPTPELPKEVVMHIGLDDPSSVEHRIDVSFLSTVDHILEPSMTLEFAPEEALYWAYAESEGSVDISTDPAIGKYRVAPTEWIVEFVSQRDLPENEQHLAAKPGVYKATIRTSTATIPVTVHYREDEITDPDNPDTGNPDPDPDTPDPEEGNGSSGGGSGGSLGWFSLLMLFCLRRHK